MITKERKEEIKKSVAAKQTTKVFKDPQTSLSDSMEVVPESTEHNEEFPEILTQGNLKVRTDYVPRSGSDFRTISENQMTYVTPSGKRVHIDEMNKSLNMELVNRHEVEKEQKRIAEQWETSLADNEDVLPGLIQIAEKRTDIFGDDEVEMGRRVGEDIKKKLQRDLYGPTLKRRRKKKRMKRKMIRRKTQSDHQE